MATFKLTTPNPLHLIKYFCAKLKIMIFKQNCHINDPKSTRKCFQTAKVKTSNVSDISKL